MTIVLRIFTTIHGSYDFKNDCKGKIKTVRVHVMKTYRRSEGTAPFILNLNTRFRPLYPRGKRSRHSLKLSGSEPIRRFFGKQRNTVSLPGLGTQVLQPVA
jgi:hypothetical protein